MAKRSGDSFRRADLFVVRVWRAGRGDPAAAAAGQEGIGWQGRVQRAVSGEARTFQGWPALIAALEALLTRARTAGPPGAGGDGTDSDDQTGEQAAGKGPKR